MKILVTGCAGFIGSHLTEFLLKRGDTILGIDNLNDYYDPKLKETNLEILKSYSNFSFRKEDICDTKSISEWKPDKICHLASMAGVRYSIENPEVYIQTNVQGFVHILKESVENNVKSIVYASSSSVYGLNKKVPFSEDDPIETCNSPYACSKKAMETLASCYHQLFKLNLIGLRFFTVYGPRGRPDMAPYKFLDSIINQKTFLKYGEGDSRRDYTYIDDIVSGIVSALNKEGNHIYNLGNSSPVTLNEFIGICEEIIGKKAVYKQIPNQLGDVPVTYADISKANKELGYSPKTDLKTGLQKTADYIIRSYSKRT